MPTPTQAAVIAPRSTNRSRRAPPTSVRWPARGPRRHAASARTAEVPRAVAELALDPQQPVVLRDPLGARRRAGLDLAGAHRDRRGPRSSCPRSRPSGATRPRPSRRRARARSPSIVSVSVPIWLSLMSTALAAPASIAAGDPLGVRDEQVVADELDAIAEPLGELAPARPSRPRRGRPRATRSGSARPSPPRGRSARPNRASGPPCASGTGSAPSPPRPVLDELGRRRVERDRDLARRAGSRPARSPAGPPRPPPRSTASDGAKPPSSPWPVARPSSWRIARSAAKISAPARSASANVSSADRHDHELLEVGRVLGVLAAVEDVEHRDRQRSRAPTPPR